MAIVSKATLKGYFDTGDKPTQAQFTDLIDSLALVCGESVQHPIVSADQVFASALSLNVETTVLASAGVSGALVPTSVAGFLTILVSGVSRRIPYFNAK